MLTDERILELWRTLRVPDGLIEWFEVANFARAVEAETRREALEEAGAELYMAACEIERLRAARDRLLVSLDETKHSLREVTAAANLVARERDSSNDHVRGLMKRVDTLMEEREELLKALTQISRIAKMVLNTAGT